MEVVAQAKSVRISPRKIRLVADMIRNMPAQKALDVLSVTNKRATMSVEKTLQSAIANAMQQANAAADSLYIAAVEVGEGQALKRFRPSTRGRQHLYKKRTSHIKIMLKTNDDKKQDNSKVDEKIERKESSPPKAGVKRKPSVAS